MRDASQWWSQKAAPLTAHVEEISGPSRVLESRVLLFSPLSFPFFSSFTCLA